MKYHAMLPYYLITMLLITLNWMACLGPGMAVWSVGRVACLGPGLAVWSVGSTGLI